MQDEKYSQLYERLMEQVMQQHKMNQQRIRKGLLGLPCVTVLFLLLVMLTDGSRNIYLLLWIATVFALAAYLIAVEYLDYEMQKKLTEVTQLEQELGGLIDGNLEEHRVARAERIQRLEQGLYRRLASSAERYDSATDASSAADPTQIKE